MSPESLKKVLVVYYSQSGQLTRVIKSVLSALDQDKGIEIVYEQIQPTKAYPFPWPFFRFFDVFPECIYLDPPNLNPFQFDSFENFDLIVLAYQPWFLSPSLPMTGFIKSPEAARVLKNKPVVTVIACRNMWLMAQERMKEMTGQVGGSLVDNIVMVDQGTPAATYVTTPRWMFTGKKDRYLGLFPPAGVSEEDIQGASRFGHALRDGLYDGRISRKKSVLSGMGATRVNPHNISAEKAARRSFLIWGKIIRMVGHQGHFLRIPVLAFYSIFLGAAILTALPVLILFRRVLQFFPAYRRKLESEKRYFESPS